MDIRKGKVSIQVAPADSKQSWMDKADLLLVVSFEILCRFVEDEGLDTTDWASSDKDKAVKKDIEYLYKWWKDPEREDNKYFKAAREILAKHGIDTLEYMRLTAEQRKKHKFSKEFTKHEKIWKKGCELAKQQDALSEVNLIKLMKLRGYLWT